MNVALVHDYLKEYGGAERVLEALHEIFPEAPVFTAFYFPQYLGPHRERFSNWQITTSFMQNIPMADRLVSPLRLISQYAFESWNLDKFDLVIVSSTGAYFPNLIRTKPSSKHLCYCHTPPRYLYGYATARNWMKYPWGRVAGEFFNHKLRQTDFLAAQRPDFFIANSIEVKGRISKFYRREATVIYPPVEIADRIKNSELRMRNKNKTYYLAGGRLARAKNIDLIIEAANKLKLPLKIFGRAFAGYGQELRERAGPTVEFIGEVSNRELSGLYRQAKALIFASEDEDFGIMPVEAQALGTSVIAYRSGGVKETIIEGKTGVFFDELNTESLTAAIRSFRMKKFKAEDCRDNAKRFSRARFKKEIINFINNNCA
ncbi:hypothetical protein A3J20_00525 [Candidatus Gottesmanbacteria bacterium RIFCSPLOWO2_02_FULL_42_29]|uniref:Glycosyl transferase family 1 domain-containing protein n=2 Tax=Candidatus Gottesmaniibacteriota TaxID=1752720 RepID=A0A1F6BC15_9BACT|nr:MAG: Glycosyl transferase group 1 [Candidatus Gottesmanbacteria bacterium GW2011_GWA2_42_18]KKS73761.1 MAG: Glycosyl transferase group 1 [Candidatus Gottesmanbacteria bacterium GW2011_GWC2_42_8]OGG09643.1 MAG: hypothetical protein A2781_02815 [Candidatus Gottesmanbacteria bacterium RIFCSPHIGHO2_01_FULL_42_27]OGG19589.1 MAG: hypothetical protein A3E72_05690 [Candidatus Gottesmanbacteria bacterium RIFCSPHIGHO2_12_FULL_43_26]OGG33809.1 MAG: hypothetical protein A3G68_04230 [Candidatus Gottesman